jgi:hypothetical protein
VLRIVFERDETAVRRQRARQPDGAITGERADLEDPPRPMDPREQVQELALGRRHADRRQARRASGLLRGIEHGIGRQQQAGNVFVDSGPRLWRRQWNLLKAF